jgi:CubicO group peptidase (beta-lactamase class C family)
MHMKRTLMLAAVLSAFATAAAAQSAATRRAREVVAVINAAPAQALRAYVDSAFGGQMRNTPPGAYVNIFLGLRERSGGLEWVRVQEESANRVIVQMTRKLTGETNAVTVEVEDATPHRLVRLDLRPPPGTVTRLATDADLAGALQKYVTALASADAFSGSVLLAKDGKVLYSGAFGSANKDFKAPNTIDTKFNLGSMNKMFTSVVIAQLVEQGKLSYDDPLSKFLPDFPSADAAGTVKIRHLLTHTSGLGSYFNDEFFRSSRERFRSVDDMLQLAKSERLAFEPGTRWAYSNTGMLVLGKVIEVVTKQDYYEYVREHISKPAGMTNSEAYELDGVNENLAVGYEKNYAETGAKRYRNNIFMHVIRGGPAGGGYSTAPDLLRFAEALTSGKLVTPATFELMTTPKPDVSSPRYGYGFQLDPQAGIAGHGGGFPGISSNLDIFKGTGYVAVVLSNYGDAGRPVVDKIRALVRDRVSNVTQRE